MSLEITRYRVSLSGCALGVIEVVAVGDDRYWLAEGSLIRFATQPEAIKWLLKLKRVTGPYSHIHECSEASQQPMATEWESEPNEAERYRDDV